MDKKIVLLLILLICTLILVPVLIFVLAVVMPCFDPFLGAAVFFCKTDTRPPIAGVLLIAVIEGFHWRIGTSLAIAVIINFTTYSAVLAELFLKLIER